MVRFQVMVDSEAYSALRCLSRQEYRDWRLQAGLLIREALAARGCLPQPRRDKPAAPAEGGLEGGPCRGAAVEGR